MIQHRLLVALVGTMLVAAGCESASTAQHAGPASSQYPSETANWKTFSSADYGYSLRFPPNWFELGNSSIGDEHWFSNEQVGSPMTMSPQGVFVGVSANCQVGMGQATLVSAEAVNPGGIAAELYVMTATSQDGAYAIAMTTVMPRSYCYRIYMESWLLATLQTNLSDFKLVLQTVHFSTRTAPAVTPRPTTLPT